MRLHHALTAYVRCCLKALRTLKVSHCQYCGWVINTALYKLYFCVDVCWHFVTFSTVCAEADFHQAAHRRAGQAGKTVSSLRWYHLPARHCRAQQHQSKWLRQCGITGMNNCCSGPYLDLVINFLHNPNHFHICLFFLGFFQCSTFAKLLLGGGKLQRNPQATGRHHVPLGAEVWWADAQTLESEKLQGPRVSPWNAAGCGAVQQKELPNYQARWCFSCQKL